MPQLLSDTDVLYERFSGVFDLTRDEVSAIGRIYNTDGRKESAKIYWRVFILRLRSAAHEESAKGRQIKALIWEPMSTTGQYPDFLTTGEMGEMLENYWVEDKSSALEQWCYLWKLRCTKGENESQTQTRLEAAYE